MRNRKGHLSRRVVWQWSYMRRWKYNSYVWKFRWTDRWRQEHNSRVPFSMNIWSFKTWYNFDELLLSWTLLYVFMIEIWLNRFQNAICKYIFHKLKAKFYVNVPFHRVHIILQHDKLIPLYHLIVFSKRLVRFQFKKNCLETYQLKIVQHAKLWSSNGPMSLIITRIRTYDHHLLDGTLAWPLIHTH